jgi:hypothetical protein
VDCEFAHLDLWRAAADAPPDLGWNAYADFDGGAAEPPADMARWAMAATSSTRSGTNVIVTGPARPDVLRIDLHSLLRCRSAWLSILPRVFPRAAGLHYVYEITDDVGHHLHVGKAEPVGGGPTSPFSAIISRGIPTMTRGERCPSM